MKRSKETLLLLLLATAITFVSCDDDDDTPPLTQGIEATVSNFYTGPLGEGAVADSTEFAILLQFESGALDLTGTISNDELEIVDMLAVPAFQINGLYDIDFTENSITFIETGSLDGDTNYWNDSYRVIEAGTIDEYVIFFSGDHNISSGTPSVSGVSFFVDSNDQVSIEISEGFDLYAGVEFTINLDN